MSDQPISLPRALSEQTLDRIVDRLGLTERHGPDGGAFLPLESQLPMAQGPIGDLRIYTGGPLYQLVTVRIVVPAMQLDSHMLFAFTPGSSAIPHFTVDSVAAGGHFAFHLDLIPRRDLGASLAYMDQVFGPIDETCEMAKGIEGLSAAHLSRRQLAIMSPWMLAYRASEDAFAQITDPVNGYLDQWFSLLDQGLDAAALDGTDGASLAARDGQNKAIIFDPDVDPVWNQIGPLVGEETGIRMRDILKQVGEAGHEVGA